MRPTALSMLFTLLLAVGSTVVASPYVVEGPIGVDTKTTPQNAVVVPTWNDAWWGTSPILGNVPTSTILANRAKTRNVKLREALRLLGYTQAETDTAITAAQSGTCASGVMPVGTEFRTANGKLKTSKLHRLSKEIPVWLCGRVPIAIVCGNPNALQAPAPAPLPKATPTPSATPRASPTPTPSPTPEPTHPGLSPTPTPTTDEPGKPFWCLRGFWNGLVCSIPLDAGGAWLAHKKHWFGWGKPKPTPPPIKPPDKPNGS